MKEKKPDFSLLKVEKEIVLDALDYFRWNRQKAAKALGISTRTLYRKLKAFDKNSEPNKESEE